MTTWVNKFKDSGYTWLAGQDNVLAGGLKNSDVTLYAGQIGLGVEYTNQTRT